MIKWLLHTILSLLLVSAFSTRTFARNQDYVDSLTYKLIQTDSDRTKAAIFLLLSNHYSVTSPDTSILYANQAYLMGKGMNNDTIMSNSLNQVIVHSFY